MDAARAGALALATLLLVAACLNPPGGTQAPDGGTPGTAPTLAPEASPGGAPGSSPIAPAIQTQRPDETIPYPSPASPIAPAIQPERPDATVAIP